MNDRSAQGFASGMTEKGAILTFFERGMGALLPLVGMYDDYTARDLKPIFKIWLTGLKELFGEKYLIPCVIRLDWQRKFLVCWARSDGSAQGEHWETQGSTAGFSDEAKWMLSWSRMFFTEFYTESLRVTYVSAAEILSPCLLELALLVVAELFLEQKAVFLRPYIEPEFQARRRRWKQKHQLAEKVRDEFAINRNSRH